MFKPISRPLHGLADFLYVPAVFLAPKILGFQGEKKAASLCQIFAGLTLVGALFTRAEWAPFRILPFRWHVFSDFLQAIAALSMPWALGFSKNKRARGTFLTMGAVGILVSLLSEVEEMD